MRNKVAVIGAGVNGLIAAREIARKGIAVTIYDQKKKPGYPARASGIFSIAGINRLGISYKPAVTNTLYGARIYSGNGKLEVFSSEPQAYVLDRLKLNEICLEEAKEAGAALELGKRLNAEELSGIHKESIIIGADGVPSIVAAHFRFPSISRHILTYRAEYSYQTEDARFAELYFEKGITPGFFAWIAPESKDVTEIAVGIDSRYGNSKASFEKFLKMQKAAEIAAHAKLIDSGASIIPSSTRRHFVDEKEEVLLVGDAAGQTKPSTGGGIVFGGSAAIAAAAAVVAHMKSGAPLAAYEKKWKREFSKEVAMHEAIRRIYSSKGFGTILRMMKSFGMEQFLGVYGDMDRPTKIAKRIIIRKRQRS